jgi:hypothetical protein
MSNEVGWRPALLSVVLLVGLLFAPDSARAVALAVADPRVAQSEIEDTVGSASRSGRHRATAPAVTAPTLASVTVPWRTMSFTIRTLTPTERFRIGDRNLTTAWPPTAIHDRYGVPMRIINGYRRYHPVGLAMLGLKYLNSYRGSKDPLFLDRAKRIAGGLRRIRVEARGAIWFPYRFTWTMHGNPTLVNRPPWYSGMAQGLALALFVRLWEETGADRYRFLADRTYDSLRNLGRRSDPCVSWVDRGRYLWIDEYPEELDRTFNGFVFALFGLFDYFHTTKDRGLYSEARHASVSALLRGGITTIRTFAATFRNPGGVSDYCLAHHYRSLKYHRIHIKQLRQLERITGDRWFGGMADLYARDVA